MARRGHRVDLYTAAYDHAYFPDPSSLGVRLILLGGRGYHQGFVGLLAMRRTLRERLSAYDAVIAVNFPAPLWVAALPRRVRVVWLCFEPKRNLYPAILYADAPNFGAHGYRTAHDPLYQGWWGRLRLLRDPHVLLPYGVRSALQRTLDQRAARRPDVILTPTPYMAGKIRAIYAPKAAVIPIWAGMDAPPLTVSKKAQPDALILIPTRLEPIKNVITAIRAVKQLAETGELGGFRVVILGTGSEEALLRAEVTSLGLGAAVQFSGFVSDTERDDWYDRAAFVVYPPLAEPFGMPVVEAGWRGRAVIAADRGGTADVIVDGVTGRLVPMTDVQALAGAIREWIISPDLPERMGEAARTQIAERCNFHTWVTQIESALSDGVQPH